MSVNPVKFLLSKWKSFCFSALALAVAGSSAWAQAPQIVWDAQQIVGNGYSGPQAIAVSKNGTVFIADTNNNRILEVEPNLPSLGNNVPVRTGSFVLNAPSSLALDAHGNLFVGDAPATGGRIIELYGDGNGNLTGVTNPTPIVAPGAGLIYPIALTFDSAGTLFIGDFSPTGAIYSLAAGTSTLQPLTFTGGGFQSGFTPAALLRDASNNLYIADNGFGTGTGGIYKAPDTGGVATAIPTSQFAISTPSGLAFNAQGDLYVLTELSGGSGANPGQQVLIIPAASPTTPYILPNNGIAAGGSMAFDNNGNLDITDIVNNNVVQLSAPNPVNLGNVQPPAAPKRVQFNLEFNAPFTLAGFATLTGGDVSSEISQAPGGTCTLGSHTTSYQGTAISNYYPYSCVETYYGTPSFPGIRNGAFELIGAGNALLATVPVWQTAFFGAEVVYPLTATTAATGLQQPQAIAISGLNNVVYVADTQAGVVYAYAGLGSSSRTTVNTGSIPLSAPSALALDGAGNLYIADFNNAEVVEVPPASTGLQPAVVNTGGLLQHPIALALDNKGNLYIGDAGPGGINAGTSNPGYIVKVPAGGAAFKLPMPSGLSVVFPQALATDHYSGDLVIGDGGDLSGAGVGVIKVYPDGSGGGNVGLAGQFTNPTGLAFDAGDNLYVLDGNTNTITGLASSPFVSPQWTVQFDNSGLAAASALAISAGGQSFVVANIGLGSSNNLIFLNGNLSTLNYGTQRVGSSATLPATVYNVGNLGVTLKGLASSGTNPAFSVSNSSTCSPGQVLISGDNCSIEFVFTPQSLGFTSLNLTVLSDAFNGSGATNTPVLTLEGTGGGAAVAHHRRHRKF